MRAMAKKITLAAAAVSVALLSGCAQVPKSAGEDPQDPFEALNRQTFAFNQAVDSAVVKPVAEGYKYITPEPVRNSVTRFYQNLGEPSNAINNVLQGKVEDGILSVFRLLINTTVGVGGLFDVAGEVGIPHKREDFGQTLGVWGVESGPYIVLPLLGPSTARDATGLAADYFTYPATYVDNDGIRWSTWGVGLINTRARLLPVTDMLDLQVDPYVATRNAFLQTRKNEIADGKAEPQSEDPSKMLDPFADDEE